MKSKSELELLKIYLDESVEDDEDADIVDIAYDKVNKDLELLEKLEKVVDILLPQTIKKIAGVPETLDLYQIKYKKVINKVHKDLILEIVDILNKKEV